MYQGTLLAIYTEVPRTESLLKGRQTVVITHRVHAEQVKFRPGECMTQITIHNRWVLGKKSAIHRLWSCVTPEFEDSSHVLLTALQMTICVRFCHFCLGTGAVCW